MQTNGAIKVYGAFDMLLLISEQRRYKIVQLHLNLFWNIFSASDLTEIQVPSDDKKNTS